ncbi:GNAT family N-acetyltransferase [Pedobacter yonginense]|uniref:GNAT family N-acetyltransferase n=1 Tax=Pedobacter yonginense TaxID=651869 RepID=A0A317EL93_9SPHI|nr:GNAT family N-acetyltransferase [Pedobacter yonginense]PWS27551.1 GNAT family N-acetyltransferase [Pedobacter yonginense]
MAELKLYVPKKSDYPALIILWEASVRATHHFLSESDIQSYKSLIFNQYLHQVELFSLKIEDEIIGFMGLADDVLQMLFIQPNFRAKGVGKQLIRYAIEHKNITKVDVNEQNLQAVGFYTHLGFQVTNRYENDAAGKPYPILSMELRKGRRCKIVYNQLVKRLFNFKKGKK